MSKAIRGTKRHCRSCGAKFYDLGRVPIVCPLCGAVYELAAAAAPAKAAPAKPAPVAEEEEAAPAEGAVFVSLEDADAEAGAGAPAEDEDLPDLGEPEEIPEDDAGGVFLEDEEEDESDVTGFIGGPVGSDEER